eukprot:112216-Rhodomonas_salina.2
MPFGIHAGLAAASGLLLPSSAYCTKGMVSIGCDSSEVHSPQMLLLKLSSVDMSMVSDPLYDTIG